MSSFSSGKIIVMSLTAVVKQRRPMAVVKQYRWRGSAARTEMFFGMVPRTAGLFQPPGDARLVEVVGRHLHFHPVSDGEAHPAFAHLAANGGQHEVFVVQFDAKHRA